MYFNKSSCLSDFFRIFGKSLLILIRFGDFLASCMNLLTYLLESFRSVGTFRDPRSHRSDRAAECDKQTDRQTDERLYDS